MLGTLPNGKSTPTTRRGEPCGWRRIIGQYGPAEMWSLHIDTPSDTVDDTQIIALVKHEKGRWTWQTYGEAAEASGGKHAILAAEASLLIDGWDLPHLANPDGAPSGWTAGEIASWYPRSESWIAAAAARTMPLGARPAPVKPAEPTPPPAPPAITFDDREPRDFPLPQEQPAAPERPLLVHRWRNAASGYCRLYFEGHNDLAALVLRVGSDWPWMTFRNDSVAWRDLAQTEIDSGRSPTLADAQAAAEASLLKAGYRWAQAAAPERPLPAGHPVVWTPMPDDRDGFLRAADGWTLVLRHRNLPRNPIVVRIDGGKVRALCGGIVTLVSGDEYALLSPPAEGAGEAVYRGR